MLFEEITPCFEIKKRKPHKGSSRIRFVLIAHLAKKTQRNITFAEEPRPSSIRFFLVTLLFAKKRSRM
ncbi:MAG: hypothetical protein ACOYJD_07720 [Christensenellales bacterium]